MRSDPRYLVPQPVMHLHDLLFSLEVGNRAMWLLRKGADLSLAI